MPYRTPITRSTNPNREYFFEIGDRVRLRLNPKWIGTVVGRSISSNVNVHWDNRGIERIESSMLIPLDGATRA